MNDTTMSTTSEPAAGFQEAADKAREAAEEMLEERQGTGELPEWATTLNEAGVGGQAAEGGSTFDSTADISTGRAENVGITTEAPNRDLPQQPQQAEEPQASTRGSESEATP